MSVKMTYRVDSCCRKPDRASATPLSAATWVLAELDHNGRSYLPSLKIGTRTRLLPASPPPTDRRAELAAIVMAMESALRVFWKFAERLPAVRYPDVTICSDSAYAVVSVLEASAFDPQSAAMADRPNRDLLADARQLYERLSGLGMVRVRHVSSAENWVADAECNKQLDRLQAQRDRPVAASRKRLLIPAAAGIGTARNRNAKVLTLDSPSVLQVWDRQRDMDVAPLALPFVAPLRLSGRAH
ncbi:hypothetical protein RB595_000267 [Gaeumannomyces hyphopodioides]